MGAERSSVVIKHHSTMQQLLIGQHLDQLAYLAPTAMFETHTAQSQASRGPSGDSRHTSAEYTR